MKEYVTLTTEPNAWGPVSAAVKSARLANGAAQAIAIFTPQIGGSVNRVYLILSAETGADLDAAAAELAALAAVVALTRQPLTPAAERNLPMLEEGPAMFTNRWFHVLSNKAGDFENDTIPVWDGFEQDTKCNVIGLWHLAPSDGVTRYLLVAKYDDLLAWSNSRFFNLAPGAKLPDWAESFARRRSYMTDTSVIATRCLGASQA
ncbi:hypothetical protein [Pseudooceanicola sp.]|uniref:hypothetical protein n=1 Tax=Pseudooceanicola sp. TaxID=1914328 RepID=UPI00261961FC|nr:hypothetical protein [Pseudooceanicola sp.]MDF1856746.1 hypothetical protein [Pseudooceanicola sp.]